MKKRYKTLLIVLFPFLLFFSVKSMNSSLSETASNDAPAKISQPNNTPPVINSTIQTAPIHLTRYSRP